jgi:predicted TIM-barrel fold metal-dependent hydrolase
MTVGNTQGLDNEASSAADGSAAAPVQIIDADTHIIEPYDLWTARTAQKWQDLVPKVVWSEERQQDVWTMPGHPVIAAAAGSATAGWREYPPSRPPRLQDADPATWDATARLAKMDEFGIHTEVLYPNIAGFGGGRYMILPDDELRLACVRAYNDWLAEWTSIDPRRFIMNCSVPFWDVPAAVKEIVRAHELGHRGIIFSSNPNYYRQPYLGDPHWDPIWDTAQELGMPVNFHIGGGGVTDFGINYEGNGARTNYAISSAQMFMSNAKAITEVIFSGICERFPRLVFVSVESGVGWVPFHLETMDWQWQNCGLHVEHPDWELPSTYFRRQFYSCFWFERETIETALRVVGEDRLLYETDYPHPTCQAPGPASIGVKPQEYIRQSLGSLSEGTTRKLLHDNAARIYQWN